MRRSSLSVRCVQTSVVLELEWPSCTWICLRLVPLSSKCVAKLWRME